MEALREVAIPLMPLSTFPRLAAAMKQRPVCRFSDFALLRGITVDVELRWTQA